MIVALLIAIFLVLCLIAYGIWVINKDQTYYNEEFKWHFDEIYKRVEYISNK